MRTLALVIGPILPGALPLSAQTAWTWQQVRDRFEAANPTLKSAQAGIDESKAAEITAFLRPNPTATATLDQLNPFAPQMSGAGQSVFRPLVNTFPFVQFSYLHEREQKRELRLETARKSTEIAVSSYADQERGLVFNLRLAYVQVLQAKALLQNAKDNLAYWDHELVISRQRYDAGDLARVDLDRLTLVRPQFESDFEAATVNLRTAKIQLLQLLNDRTPIEQFDVSGAFEYSELLLTQDDFRSAAAATRPDLRVALQNVDLARLNHRLAVANGSTDPTFSIDFARNPPIPAYFGVSINIPIRIFDRNQGEKARTQIDIGRNEKLADAAQAQVYSDVDSAYVTIIGALNLLRPYKTQYIDLAARTRDTVQFAYQNGGASLLDYLDAEKAYRDVRLAYLNLIGSWMTSAAQMNMAVGREVIQ